MDYMSRAILELGHDVEVISGPPYPRLDPRVKMTKLESLDLYAKPKNWMGIPSYPAGAPKGWTDIQEYITHISGGFGELKSFGERLHRHMRGRAHHYDVVHDNQTLCWGLLKVRALGLPVAGTIHHPITRDRDIAIAHAKSLKLKLLIRRWHSFVNMQKKVARRLDPVIVVSESTKRDVVREFGVDPKHMRVVLHGINATDFRPEPSVPRLSNRIMAVASADVALKGLIYLIRAYAELVKTRPDLELLVVSKLREGNTSRELDELGLRDRVKFVSGLTIDEMRRYYAEATIAVSPSVYEGFGFPAGEAMACGVPVVSTDGGSLPEVVGDAGIIVPTKDHMALARAIGDLLDNPDRRARLGAAGYRRIQDNFLWSRAARDAVNVYKEAIATHYGMARAND
ncbi:MAG: glycosyltransferase family 4 protein [Alphaproteobacteria bacterium]|nr:glycosyltransferase family 4 protein [Alphaproteobacteria bacterium]